jgi:hypothetical protein
MINFESRRPEPLRRLAHKAAEIIPMSWIRPAALLRIDRGMFRLSRGRTTFSALVSGLPIVMLTTTGARTGELRTVPVLAMPDNDHLILIASNYGRPSNPVGTTTWAPSRMSRSSGKAPRSRCVLAS